MRKNFWQKLKKPILALAPMAGITDSAFRQICRQNGADAVYSEMASATALAHKPEKTFKMLEFSSEEKPYIVQLFGNQPEDFSVATKIISQKIRPDGIDINFGCPARKVFKVGAGCALMRDKEKAAAIIRAVLKNTSLPISIKIRAGIENFPAEEFFNHIKDLPFVAIMVHGRTYEKGFAGDADFTLAEKIKFTAPEKIVLANGGIFSAEQATKILKKHPALDGLGIARGAWGQPFIFEEIKNLLAGKNLFLPRNNERLKKIMLRHAELARKNKGVPGFLELRKHLAWYVKGFPGAGQIRQELMRLKTFEEIRKKIENLP